MRLLHAVTLGMVCAACSRSPAEQQQDDLTIASARWRAASIADYSFELQRACFCAPIATRLVNITVHHGVWATLTYVDDGSVADTSLFRDFLTMERVFSFLRGALEDHPAMFTATYDTPLGYPTQVNIDYRQNIADDELSLRLPMLRIVAAP